MLLLLPTFSPFAYRNNMAWMLGSEFWAFPQCPDPGSELRRGTSRLDVQQLRNSIPPISTTIQHMYICIYVVCMYKVHVVWCMAYTARWKYMKRRWRVLLLSPTLHVSSRNWKWLMKVSWQFTLGNYLIAFLEYPSIYRNHKVFWEYSEEWPYAKNNITFKF
jgi:hypothetical protein